MNATTRSALLTMVAVVGALSGCAGEAGAGCSEDPSYPSPAEAVDAADIVVTAAVDRRVGTVDVDGSTANVYEVSTVGRPVYKGEDVGLSELRVVSTPSSCAAEAYPDGDPLDTEQPVVLFLTRDAPADDYRTLSVEHGVLPAPEGETLPSSWP